MPLMIELWLVLILFNCYNSTVTTNHLFSLMAIDAGIREAGVLIPFKLIDSIIHQGWKSRACLTPEGKAMLTPENFFILTPLKS